MGGGGSQVKYVPMQSSSQQTATIPEELKPLFSQTASGIAGLQNLTPISGYSMPHIQGVAPLTATQQWGLGQVQDTMQTPAAQTLAMNYATMAPSVAGRTPTGGGGGGGIETNPAYIAAKRAYESEALPLIQNQMALAGLGRSSSLGGAVGRGWSQMALPVVQQILDLENQAIQRESGTLSSLVPALTTLGTTETDRRLSAINAALQAGSVEQAQAQAALDAEYADYLRRQALAEQALFGPMGMFPSALGQATSTSGTSPMVVPSSGGLFK